MFNIISLILSLCLSGFAGWLAARIMNVDASNTVQNVILGIIGGFVAGLIGGFIGLRATGPIGSTIFSVAGACLVVWVYNNYIKK